MAAPTVTSVTPNSGGAGNTVLIVGTGFAAATAVTFGGIAADFAIVDATTIAATTPAGTGGAAQVVVTNADGSSEDAVAYTYTADSALVLFTVAEARAFDKALLQSSTTFKDAAISTEETEIRAKFERIIGVALTPTATTEYQDGNGSPELYLGHHNPWAEATPRSLTVTSITIIDTDGTETDFTAAELTDVVKYPHKLVRRSGRFPAGHRNVKVVYTHGYTAPPADIKTAALHACVQELVPTSLPSSVIDGGDGQINWSRVKDPGRGRWYGNESVDAVLREHRALETPRGIA